MAYVTAASLIQAMAPAPTVAPAPSRYVTAASLIEAAAPAPTATPAPARYVTAASLIEAAAPAPVKATPTQLAAQVTAGVPGAAGAQLVTEQVAALPAVYQPLVTGTGDAAYAALLAMDPAATSINGWTQQPIQRDGGVTDGLGVAAAVTAAYGQATGNAEASMAGGFLGIAAAVSAGFDSGTFGMGGQSVTSAPDGVGIGPGPNGANNGDGSPY